jgi:hypothetical protein
MRAPMRKMIAFLLLGSRFGGRRKHVDWPLVLAWTGIAVALWIVLAVR